MSLLSDVANLENLESALHRVRPTFGSSASYSQEYNLFKSKQTRNLRSLASKVEHGTFVFQRPREIVLPKTNRPILICKLEDRVVERCVLDVLSPYLERALALPGTFGRTRGWFEEPRSLELLASTIVKIRKTHPFVFETDIKKFFPTINHELLLTKLKEFFPEEELRPLLADVLARRFSDLTLLQEDDRHYFEHLDRGVPQGSYLSPLLSNLYLLDFDQALEKKQIKYVRYVDDLLIFSSTTAQSLSAERFVHRELAKLKLTAHLSHEESDQKGHQLAEEETFSFVGLEFLKSGKVLPTRKAIDRFHERVIELENECVTLSDLLLRLRNFTSGWNNAYAWCQISDSMFRKLNDCQLQAVNRWIKNKDLLQRSYSKSPAYTQARKLGLHIVARPKRKQSSELQPMDEFDM